MKLSKKSLLVVSVMLFALFFGAGNLIFPPFLGQNAGENTLPAMVGFLATAVVLPVLGVVVVARFDGLEKLGKQVGARFALVFTVLIYLSIGPGLGIPRAASVPFEMAVAPYLPEGSNPALWMAAYSLGFFLIALWLCLNPGKLVDRIGRGLTPALLALLTLLFVSFLFRGETSVAAAQGGYQEAALLKGFTEGYNTMDALASLAFGIVVVQVIRDLGVTEPDAVAGSTVRAGIFSCLLMAAIYVAVTIVGVQSRGLFETSENGGIALAQIAQHYLGSVGLLILAATVTLACLKTSVGLITSCAETFTGLFPKGPTYRVWAVIFSLVSLLFANFGLSSIIGYSVPVLMFLYPLAITLIVLSLFGKFFAYDRAVFVWTTALTLVGALYDFFAALPAPLLAACRLDCVLAVLRETLPLAKLGLFWVLPALLGLVIGLILHFVRSKAND